MQRRWSAERPAVYDKATRVVCLDIIAERRADEGGNWTDGYSYISVELDRQVDYGHIKSQLIEAGYAQKDEFGLLMNAVGDIITAAGKAGSWDEFKAALDTEDIRAFSGFTEFRAMCAGAARAIMGMY